MKGLNSCFHLIGAFNLAGTDKFSIFCLKERFPFFSRAIQDEQVDFTFIKTEQDDDR